jgi:transcriptional regulator with XRE-family HTH domain
MTTGIKGARVRQLREDLGMSQAELARAVSRLVGAVNQSSISNVENGAKGLRVDALIALTLALQTSSDYLLGLTDDPEPRSALTDQVVLVEHDPVRRKFLQDLFDSIEALPADLRLEYWKSISTMYDGLVARRENERRSTAVVRRNNSVAS